MPQYQCIYFEIEELMPPEMIEKHGREKCWEFLDERLLRGLDQIRKKANVPIIVNNWHIGGNFKYSGFRPSNCSIGADESQHKFGRAADPKCKKGAAWLNEIISELAMLERNFPITYLEIGKTWSHVDVRNSKFEGLHEFRS